MSSEVETSLNISGNSKRFLDPFDSAQGKLPLGMTKPESYVI